jgi:hypothetical protein
MTISPRGEKGGRVVVYWPACACGLTFKTPWELTAHFLEVYPPSALRPDDDGEHVDATRLRVKLDTGSPGAWEVVTWASDPRKDHRVAASIAHRVKSGDLRRFDTMIRQDIRDTYMVSLHVAGNAMNILLDHGVFRNYGSRNGVACDDIDEAIGGSFSYGQMLHMVMVHVAGLEGEVSALRKILAAPKPSV